MSALKSLRRDLGIQDQTVHIGVNFIFKEYCCVPIAFPRESDWSRSAGDFYQSIDKIFSDDVVNIF